MAIAYEFQLSKKEVVEFVAAGSPKNWRPSHSAVAVPEIANLAPISDDSSPAQITVGAVEVEADADGRVMARYTAQTHGDFFRRV